jgi:polysaccharide biosynthesis transport protein
MASYVEVVQSQQLSGQVIGELELDVTHAELSRRVTASVVPNTSVLDVTVTDTSAGRAQEIAAAYGRFFTQDVTTMETPARADASTVRVTTVQPADLDRTPVSPDVARTIASGVVLGLLLGIVGALLRARLDGSVRGAAQVQALTGAPLLGVVLEDAAVGPRQLITGVDDTSTGGGALAGLCLAVRATAQDDRAAVTLLAGPLGGEGCSTVAVSLAAALARSGSRVMLIDADLRRARISRLLGLSDRMGLVEVAAGRAALAEVVRPAQHGALTIVPAGAPPHDAGEILRSAGMRSLLDALGQDYDHVIIDTPPVLPTPDAAELGTLVDQCVLVGRFRRTQDRDLAAAARSLSDHGAKLSGVVLTRVPERFAVTRRFCYRYQPDPDRAFDTRVGRGRSPETGPAPRPGSFLVPVAPVDVK